MELAREIISMIDGAKQIPVPVISTSHLYTDIALDSMAFIALLMEIEGRYGILFDLDEMEECLEVARLIELVEEKGKEVDYASGITDKAQQS